MAMPKMGAATTGPGRPLAIAASELPQVVQNWLLGMFSARQVGQTLTDDSSR
jgi:hypothetical protein